MIKKLTYKMKPPVSAKPRKSILKKLGCVGLWAMNENGGDDVFDLSGKGLSGVITGATWARGKFGSALNFNNGADQLLCGTLPALTACTLIIWVKNAPGAAGMYWSAGIGTEFYFFRNNDTTFRFRHAAIGDGNTYLTVGNFCDDTWHQIGCLWDGSNTYGIRDGVIYDVGEAATGILGTNGLSAYIGRIPVVGLSTVAIIDFPMLCDRGLTESEVAKLYARPFYLFDRPAQNYFHVAGGQPPAITPMFMDLGTMYWTVKKASGLYTRM